METFSELKEEYEETYRVKRSKNLIFLRKKIANITQDEFCESTSIKKANLSSIENGKKDLSLANILAYKKYFKEHHGLDLSIDYLLGFTDKLENKSEEVCNQLGLSEESIRVLIELHDCSFLQNAIEYIIKNRDDIRKIFR